MVGGPGRGSGPIDPTLYGRPLGIRSAAMNDDTRKQIALWRLAVLGPLMSARLEHGDRRAYFEEAAGRFLKINKIVNKIGGS